MCGIFGYVSDKPIGKNLEKLLDIGMLNIKRGNQAFGVLGIAEAGLVILRVNNQFYANLETFSFLQPCNIVLFHLLSSTGTEKRIHPFETDQFIFAHNGLLLDYQKDGQLFSNLGPTDSQYLLSVIERSRGTVVEKIKLANEHFNGQRACWLWDKLDQALYLWRVMSPLHINIQRDYVMFSSIKVSEEYTNISEGAIFQIKDMRFKKVGNFEFYSPYYQGDK